jgi:hypothetical protein
MIRNAYLRLHFDKTYISKLGVQIKLVMQIKDDSFYILCNINLPNNTASGCHLDTVQCIEMDFVTTYSIT